MARSCLNFFVSWSLLTLVAGATHSRTGDEACSGEKNLAQEVASCFAGEALGESVYVKVLAYNATAKEGTMQLRGSGVSETACETQFSQQAQAINLYQVCLPSGVSSITMKYCSDQDSFLLQAMVGGFQTNLFLEKASCSNEALLAQPLMRRDSTVKHHSLQAPA
ncbi:unnamed protein product [Symbiodinium pilosum]|uniref:Secreted protein n=1 Tax=Symbiodinium pilosum TaxID=2952 RepID=A0A812XGU0_SYMPI|nr:unnamed protein product [Symbiodinium pilosum]